MVKLHLMNRLLFILPVLWFLATTQPARGEPAARDLVDPFVTSNLNPFVNLHTLPANRPARVTGKGRFEWLLTTELANNFTSSVRGQDSITIDGESWRTAISLSYGINNRWELLLTVPYTRHQSGSLDGFVEDWHQWFGLPNSGRDLSPRDQLLYSRVDDGVEVSRIDRSTSGVGDITIGVAYELAESQNSAWSLSGGVKLPTGDADKLTGAGAADYFVAIRYSRYQFMGLENLAYHGRAGILALGDSDLPGAENLAIFGSSTLAWQPWDRVSLKTQLNLNTAIYDSRLRELGDHSLQLTLGGSVRLTTRTVLDIGVVEDIVTDTSPDVVFHFNLRTRL